MMTGRQPSRDIETLRVEAIVVLWAIHISDGFLQWPWLLGGYLTAGLLLVVGAWGIREAEIPHVAVLTAAFFVASLIHVPVPMGPRTHLLLNGLLGVVLGRRALLAIPVGLFLQAALFGHGGWTALGVNCCVMALPALLAWGLFANLRRLPWLRRPGVRSGLVVFSTVAFLLSAAYAGTLLWSNPIRQVDHLDASRANAVTFHPLTLLLAVLLGLAAAWLERRLEHAPDFPLGLLVGGTAVLATVALNSLVLIGGGAEDWHALALVTWLVHLPLAVLEGFILGFTIGFLARVKPEMLGGPVESEPCLVEAAP
jgi:cobalt/nickel transport system permease protein